MIQSMMFVILALTATIAQENNGVPVYSEPVSLIEYCRILETPTELTPDQVDQLFLKNNTVLAPQSDTQGFSQNYFWISFDLENFSQLESPIIELDNPHIDEVRLYQSKSKWELVGFGGDRNRVFNNRSFLNRRYVFPLEDLGTNNKFLLMIDKRNAAVSFPLKIWDRTSFEHNETRLNMIFGVYFGMLFIMSFVALSLGILLRKNFLWIYGIYAIAMILYIFTALGFSFQYLYPSFGSLNNYMRPALILIIASLSTIFTRDYLSLDKNNKVLSALLKLVNTIIIGLFVFGLFFTNVYEANLMLFLNILYAVLFIIFGISLVAGIMALWHTKKNAIIYLMAFSAVIIGNTLYIFVEYGFLQEGNFFINPIMIGSGIELMIFSGSMIFSTRGALYNMTTRGNESAISPKSKTEPILELSAQINYISGKETDGKPNGEIGITGQKNKHFVPVNQITHIKSQGHYLLIYVNNNDKPIIERLTFDEILTKLPKEFLRIHRSYMVHTAYVTKYNSSNVWLNYAQQLPLSRTFKAPFLKFMAKEISSEEKFNAQ